jgi:hypothetical protein
MVADPLIDNDGIELGPGDGVITATEAQVI